jgi:hypothetical protein
MSKPDDILLIAKCLAEAEQRLRALESERKRDSATRADVNRLEGQVMGLSKQLAAATNAASEGAKREFSKKSVELGERYSTELESLRKEIHDRAFAEIRGFNPVGEWKQGMTLNRLDVVYHAGSSYLVLENGVTEKPKPKSKKFQLLARRGGSMGGGGGGGSESDYVGAPASASAQGQVGQWSYDAEYYYRCVAANTWLRTSLATW